MNEPGRCQAKRIASPFPPLLFSFSYFLSTVRRPRLSWRSADGGLHVEKLVSVQCRRNTLSGSLYLAAISASCWSRDKKQTPPEIIILLPCLLRLSVVGRFNRGKTGIRRELTDNKSNLSPRGIPRSYFSRPTRCRPFFYAHPLWRLIRRLLEPCFDGDRVSAAC